MTVEEILRGESQNTEFKVTLSTDSEKYVKTIIAFANSQGGRLIVGVEDISRRVIGIDEDSLFQLMDSISNAVSDSCEPQIIPNIEPQTEAAIEKLCQDIVSYREKMGLTKREVGINQLVSWKLLKKENDLLLASNAFVLLTSDFFPFSKTQCAVFKGTERTVFLDKREFSGPIYEQINEAVHFVLRNIRLGATIDDLIRKESYELPLDAIREMIINAHCHRNMTDDSSVQVAIYDDRLEVTSPGGLYNGLTYEELMEGHSKIRNRAIANIFNKMGLVEAWGTGVRRIMAAAKKYGLPTPEIQAFDNMFRVNLFRKNLPTTETNIVREASQKVRRKSEKSSEKVRRKFGEGSEKIHKNNDNSLNTTQKKILNLLSKNAHLSASKMAEEIGISRRSIEKNIQKLKEQGILIRHGSPKNGYWEIVG